MPDTDRPGNDGPTGPQESGELPSGRADPEVEKIRTEIQVCGPWATKILFTLRAVVQPRGPVGIAIAIVVLAAVGCMCAEVLAAIGAPGWAPLAGFVFPTAVYFPLYLITRTGTDGSGRRRR